MATAQADHEALVEVRTSRRWTYRELAEEVDTVALGLLATGIVRG
jgi:fatty-acyl-CoA synthase